MVTPLILLGKKPSSDLEAKVASGQSPRVEYLELARRMGARILDHRDVEQSHNPLVRQVAKRLGPNFGLALLGFLQRKSHGPIYATGEDVGMPLGILLRGRRERGRLTMVVHNAGTPKRRALLKALGPSIYHRVICLGTEQRRVLTRDIGLPEEKVEVLYNWIDPSFYAPKDEGDGDYVLAVGMEQRDYPTLQAAAKHLDVPFHVVASGWSPSSGYARAEGLREQERFTIGSGYSNDALKALYAKARFVVVPIRNVTYAAGVTAILEACAMGKAVVASASPGILDYLRDGQVGRMVPVGDVAAMRRALVELWSNPAECRRIGRQNRAWIEDACNMDLYVDAVARLMQQDAATPSTRG